MKSISCSSTKGTNIGINNRDKFQSTHVLQVSKSLLFFPQSLISGFYRLAQDSHIAALFEAVLAHSIYIFFYLPLCSWGVYIVFDFNTPATEQYWTLCFCWEWMQSLCTYVLVLYLADLLCVDCNIFVSRRWNASRISILWKCKI